MKFFGTRKNAENAKNTRKTRKNTRKRGKFRGKLRILKIFSRTRCVADGAHADAARCGRRFQNADALRCGRGLFAHLQTGRVRESIQCFQELQYRLPSMIDEEAFHAFLSGLVPHLQEHVGAHAQGDLKQAMAMA